MNKFRHIADEAIHPGKGHSSPAVTLKGHSVLECEMLKYLTGHCYLLCKQRFLDNRHPRLFIIMEIAAANINMQEFLLVKHPYYTGIVFRRTKYLSYNINCDINIFNIILSTSPELLWWNFTTWWRILVFLLVSLDAQ